MARMFCQIFAGNEEFYGTYELPSGTKAVPGEKFLGRAQTKRAIVTVELYNQHLKGEGHGLGICPIRKDGNLTWFAIDVDDYENKGPEHWSELVDKHALPLIVTRSKSNGTHLWCFLTAPISATEARKTAGKYLRKLKLPTKTEIFPKQTKLDGDAMGNWINLPYFGDTRVAVHKKRDLKLAEFEQLVAAREVTPADLQGNAEQTEETDTKKMPPCIEVMEKIGLFEGGRDNALFHVGIYLARRYPEDWANELTEWNERHCEPPLDMSDVARIINSIGRNSTYNYKCSEAPMSENCDRTTCLRREYGIGNAGDEAYTDHPITGLTRLMTEPVSWLVEVSGTRVACSTEQLTSFTKFMMRVMEELRTVIPERTAKQWSQEIAALMQSAEDEQVPAPITESGQVEDAFYSWTARNVPVANQFEEVANGAPYYDAEKDAIFFQGLPFMTHLKGTLTVKMDEKTAWAKLSQMGATETKRKVYGKMMTLWHFPCNGEKWFETPEIVQDRF
ncbi:MAG: primase C-terminal domain-containing protein [Nitrospiraceae bacterium]